MLTYAKILYVVQIDGNYPRVYQHGGGWSVFQSIITGDEYEYEEEATEAYTHLWIAAGSYIGFGNKYCRVLVHVSDLSLMFECDA